MHSVQRRKEEHAQRGCGDIRSVLSLHTAFLLWSPQSHVSARSPPSAVPTWFGFLLGKTSPTVLWHLKLWEGWGSVTGGVNSIASQEGGVTVQLFFFPCSYVWKYAENSWYELFLCGTWIVRGLRYSCHRLPSCNLLTWASRSRQGECLPAQSCPPHWYEYCAEAAPLHHACSRRPAGATVLPACVSVVVEEGQGKRRSQGWVPSLYKCEFENRAFLQFSQLELSTLLGRRFDAPLYASPERTLQNQRTAAHPCPSACPCRFSLYCQGNMIIQFPFAAVQFAPSFSWVID